MDDVDFVPGEFGGWQADVILAGRKIPLRVDEDNLSSAAERQINVVLYELEELDQRARDAILDAYADDVDDDEDGPVSMFVAHLTEEIDSADQTTLFGTATPTGSAFLQKLILRSVSFHADGDEDDFSRFDYTLPGDLTQYVVAVRFDAGANPVGVDMTT
jgi:hypothetical protein